MRDLKNLNYLQKKTRKLLEDMIETCPFLSKYVLVGGSSLALHLCHRKSEDLDFFTYQSSDYDIKEILKYIKNFKQKEILNQTDEQIDLLLDGVKVTFFDANWAFLKPNKISTFNLASLEQIAAMKTNTLFLRAKYRDYYDLYYLVKQMGLAKVFDVSKNIVEGINYKLFLVALLYIDDIEDDNIEHLKPKEKINKKQIREFFEKRI